MTQAMMSQKFLNTMTSNSSGTPTQASKTSNGKSLTNYLSTSSMRVRSSSLKHNPNWGPSWNPVWAVLRLPTTSTSALGREVVWQGTVLTEQLIMTPNRMMLIRSIWQLLQAQDKSTLGRN